MVLESSLGKVAINIEVTMFAMLDRALVKCTGLMGPFTKATGNRVFKMDLESWSSQMAIRKLAFLSKISSGHILMILAY